MTCVQILITFKGKKDNFLFLKGGDIWIVLLDPAQAIDGVTIDLCEFFLVWYFPLKGFSKLALYAYKCLC